MSIFIEDLPYMLPTNFRFIWPIGFREKDHLEIDQSETRIVYGGHVLTDQDNMSNLYRCLLPSFSSFGQVVSQEKIFLNWPIRKKNCLWWPCLLIDRNKISNLYGGPFIDASYKVSLHLAEGFQRRRLKCEKLTDDR